MSTIGRLHPQDRMDFWKDLKGHVRTLRFNAEIRITRNADQSSNPDAPTHKITARGPTGEVIEVGSAWTKIITRGEFDGDEFLSATIDDPSFDHSLNFAVFRDGEVASATWRRRQDKS